MIDLGKNMTFEEGVRLARKMQGLERQLIPVKIQQYYENDSPFRFEMSVESKDVNTHSAMTDLPEYQRELIRAHMIQLGHVINKLLVAIPKKIG